MKEDVNLNLEFEELLKLNPNEEDLNRIFEELEFAAIKKDEEERPTKDSKYDTVLTKSELNTWISKINKSKAFAIDTETDSVETVSAKLLGISLSVKENEGCYIPIGHDYDLSLIHI